VPTRSVEVSVDARFGSEWAKRCSSRLLSQPPD
jgi:hypothetical protein